MTPFAHIAGMPVEETLPSLAGAGAALALARAWMVFHLRPHPDDRG